jgi:ankyrin repeat protein
MLDRQMNGIDSKMLLVEYRHIRQTKPSISNNHVFQFTKEDLKIYKDTYCKEVIIFAKWEREHLSSMRRLLGSGETENDQVELLEKPYEQIERNQVKLELNSPDLFGNTALHLASLKGNTEIVKLLISFHADMEIQNKEFFKPRELT